MNLDIKSIYEACSKCRDNAISKTQPHCEVVPSQLMLLAPNEKIYVDFFVWGQKNVLVICDRHSGSSLHR